MKKPAPKARAAPRKPLPLDAFTMHVIGETRGKRRFWPFQRST
jgi:hypothetical protein